MEDIQEPKTVITTIENPNALPQAKTSNPKINFFAGPVYLQNMSPVQAFLQQTDDEDLCKSICSNIASSSVIVKNIENCKLDLVADWREIAAEYANKENPNNQQIGVVECNAMLTSGRKGRIAMTPTKTNSVSNDWGGYFARAAQEEATAVFSFQEFLAHLHQWDAPDELKDRCQTIIQEEQIHTLMMSALAERHGQESVAIEFPDHKHATPFELALHNALAGCIEETWSAVLAEYQSQKSARYTHIFNKIAKDEASHAQFSWDAHQWLLSLLSEKERNVIRETMIAYIKQIPAYTYNSELGEMNEDTYHEAWTSFCSNLRPLIHQQAA